MRRGRFRSRVGRGFRRRGRRSFGRRRGALRARRLRIGYRM